MGMCGAKDAVSLRGYSKGLNGGGGGTQNCTHGYRGIQRGIERDNWEEGGRNMRK